MKLLPVDKTARDVANARDVLTAAQEKELSLSEVKASLRSFGGPDFQERCHIYYRRKCLEIYERVTGGAKGVAHFRFALDDCAGI